jgi:sulfonate transport system ATP-binding protein
MYKNIRYTVTNAYTNFFNTRKASMNVDVKNICFSFPKKPVLDDLTFHVASDTILGVLGSSGCGKSTLLRIICGLYKNSNGNVLSGTVMLNDCSDTQLLRKKGAIGFMFQEPTLLPNLTVEENICLPLQMNRLIGNNNSLAKNLISVVGLNAYSESLPSQLSGGMKTRAALARTFITRPELLLLDEPFSALDYGWKMDLYNKLGALIKQRKTTVIIVSHDIEELFLLSDKVILISKTGKLVHETKTGINKPNTLTATTRNEYISQNINAISYLQAIILEEQNSCPVNSQLCTVTSPSIPG